MANRRCYAVSMMRRINRTCCSASNGGISSGCCCRWVDSPSRRFASCAAELGLRVADKKDSQEICFVTSGRYDEFVKRRSGRAGEGGEFVSTAGEVLGKHEGIEGFTVGQRKGLGIALGEPRYVVRIEADTKRVVLGERSEMHRRTLTAAATNWLTDLPLEEPLVGLAQIRYNAAPAPATFTLLSENRLAVEFTDPQFGVAPGQAVVCYDGDRVLGGGWIES